MVTVHVRIIYGDYEIHYSEQEYHDNRIEDFKFNLGQHIRRSGFWLTSFVDVYTEYYPEKQKFKITDYTKRFSLAIENALKNNREFCREYLL